MAVNRFDTALVLDDTAYSDANSTGFFGFQTLAGPRIFPYDGDPSAGAGVVAPIGSLILRNTAGFCQIWQKTQAGNTNWVVNGTLAGAVTLTAIDSSPTPAFAWTIAAAATGASIGTAAVPGMMVFDGTGGATVVSIGAVLGLRINDTRALRFGTPGTDVVMTADGTDVRVTGTGRFNLQDAMVLGFGTDSDAAIAWNNGAVRLGFNSADLGPADLAGLTSGAFQFVTGNMTQNAAFVSGNSGGFVVLTGSTDCTNGGGTGGATGAISFTTGSATSTAGTSGNTSGIGLTTGNSDDGGSGNITLTTGTAGTTRGFLNIDIPIIDVATQGTAIRIIDNDAGAFAIAQATNVYLNVDTTNNAEVMSFGNTATNPAFAFNGAGRILTDGIDHGARLVLTELFTQRPLLAASIAATNASKVWEVAGVAAADAGSVFDVGGGISLTSAAVAGNQEIIWPNTTGADTEQSPFMGCTWNTSQRPKMKANIKIVDTANTMIGVGFKIGTVLDNGTDADQIWVGYNSAGTLGGVAANFVVVKSAGGVDAQYDTAVVVGAGSYRIVIDVQGDRTVLVYINGLLVATTTALAAGIVTLKPFAGVQALGAAGRQFTVQRLTCSVNYY